MKFQLESPFTPTGDQPGAIKKLTQALKNGTREQVLLGVTGSGKTFTMANVIKNLQRPALIISHNKTLAAQLYQEFKSFFPKNAVSYFVSYYDYYQPEAYIPQSDTYIEKETEINEEIDKLRLASTTNLLTRADTIIVASVSCIYNIGSPKEYGNFILDLRKNLVVSRQSIIARLVELQYERNDFGFSRGTFRIRGDAIDVFPAYEDTSLRLTHDNQKIIDITRCDPVSGAMQNILESYILYPAKHYMTDPNANKQVFLKIEEDLQSRILELKKNGKVLEAHRIGQKVRYDLEMIQELGYVNGIENYSRYFDGRKPGDPPYTLFDYYQEKYGNEWLLFIDESHMTIPQVRGMYSGDRSRKETLINFGFRLPAALDNRPLRFDEFLRRLPATTYVSATPSEWEIERAYEASQAVILGIRQLAETPESDSGRVRSSLARMTKDNTGVVEQLVRPTGLVDPQITIRPTKNQIPDLENEIRLRIAKKERVLVTTITKRMAEDLSAYFDERGLKVHYLHSDVQTLERSDILDDLRSGTYDVVIGINLLREGLDLPEVSLVAILDADKEGFLRSEVSLIQTMGRAARHLSGRVIMYADKITGSMARAIDEVKRRRDIQLKYNQTHKITPISISKPIREKLVEQEIDVVDPVTGRPTRSIKTDMLKIATDDLTPKDIQNLVKRLEKEMRFAAQDLHFELAAKIRDRVRELKRNL